MQPIFEISWTISFSRARMQPFRGPAFNKRVDHLECAYYIKAVTENTGTASSEEIIEIIIPERHYPFMHI